MRSVLILVCYLVLFLVLSGCEKKISYECKDPIGCVTIQPGEPIIIGVAQDLSGSSSMSGNVQLRAIQLAMDERGYQLLGHPVELQVRDEGCSFEGGKNAALFFLSQPKLIAVIGTSCSTAAVPASKLLSEKGLVMISGLNSAPSLTALGRKKGENWQPGYFRTSSNNMLRTLASAKFAIQKLGVKKAATIDDGDIYTKGAARVFTEEFTRLGGEVVFTATIDKGDTRMEPVLTLVKNSNAELLYFPVFPPEALHLVRRVRQMPSLDHLILLGGSALVIDTFVRDLGKDGVGSYFESPILPAGPGLSDLVQKYTAKYKEHPLSGYYSTAYDATNLLLKAIEKVAQTENGRLHIGRQALRDTLYATKDFMGTTGVLSCDEFGDCGRSALKIVRMIDPASGAEGLKANVIYVYKDQQRMD